MTELRDLGQRGRALIYFNPADLEVKPGWNPRDFSLPENQEHVEELAAKIAANGFYDDKPLAIYKEVEKDATGEKINHVYIADGECRWRAAKRAIELGSPLERIPCIQLSSGLNDLDILYHRRLSNTGKRLTPLEEVTDIKHLIAFGAQMSDIAVRLGKTEAYLRDLLANLGGAPNEVQELVKEGSISATEAVKVIKEEGKAAGAEIIKEAVRVAKDEAKKRGRPKGSGKATARHLKPLKEKKPKLRLTKPDNEVVAYSGVQGEFKVTFGEKIVLMTRPQWYNAIEKICDKIGWPPSALIGIQTGPTEAQEPPSAAAAE